MQKLTTDKGFYGAFVKDPKAALASLGYPTELAACVDGSAIATMEQLAAARQTVVESLTKSAKLTQSIFKLSTA
ncbi:MAG: NHLP-related RiPP peptide [Xanthomonadaceae bacterium]|nr:NHLP-related RiPP peptide [Xanthomonadaceae bacterium]